MPRSFRRHGAHALAQAAYGVYAWLIVAALTIGTLPLAAFARDARSRLRIVHRAAATLVRCCGIPIGVEGLEHVPAGAPAVIVVNHASYADALVLLAALPSEIHFAAKAELARAPLLGSVLRRLGTYFVERVDPTQGIEDIREITAAVGRGETIVFFPEGTFTRAPGLAEFRLGAFAASAATDVPVVPVVLRGTRSVLRDGRWLPIRHPIAVSVQPPVMPLGRDWAATVRLRDRVREVMLRECGEPDLRVDVPPTARGRLRSTPRRPQWRRLSADGTRAAPG